MCAYSWIVLLVLGVSVTFVLAEDGFDVGEPVIQDEELLLPELGDKKKRGYYYYYYFSSSSSSSIPKNRNMVPVGPIIDHSEDAVPGTGKAPGCSDKYTALSDDHTMCAFVDNPDVREYGISRDDIDLIVKQHNDYRAEEPAEDMAKMYWDDEIAVIAQKLAQSCHKGHDLNHQRLVPDYNIPIGQNWCGNVNTWGVCMQLWHNEKVNFKYGKKSKGIIGHYTQIANDRANAIGCGFARCPAPLNENMVCNYAYGQTSKDIKKPFTLGEKCAMCPGHCVDGLCDCGNKVCKNKGELNKNTCQCRCRKPFIGEVCDEADCENNKDSKSCGGGNYVLENCTKFANLPGICPNTCGVCP